MPAGKVKDEDNHKSFGVDTRLAFGAEPFAFRVAQGDIVTSENTDTQTTTVDISDAFRSAVRKSTRGAYLRHGRGRYRH